MPILNYTTQIESAKTVSEILALLARVGARSVSIDYNEDHEPQAVTFLAQVAGRWINFRLPSNPSGVYKAIQKDPKVPRSLKTEAQARRVAWRITKDWCEAQMAIIAAGQADLPEVFLPYAVNPRSGRTLYEEVQGGTLLLGEGE